MLNQANKNCSQFLRRLPKAELHVHIEGTLEPEQLLLFAKRNNVSLPTETILSKDKKSYRYSNFDSFITTYITSTQALCNKQDFYEMTLAYLEKVSQQGVVHTEIYFDIQTYLPRNIDPDDVVYGIHQALEEGQKILGISSSMIFSLLRHETQKEALENFNLIKKRYQKIVSTIGLASNSTDNPITKFKSIFHQAHNAGYHCVAHLGEFDSPELIWQALREIPIERIDHGVECIRDQKLMAELAQRKIPLTICPLSNVALGKYKNLQQHPIRKIYDAGITVTINSDDPSFFNGYIGDNYQALLNNNILSCKELVECARNSINASFMEHTRKKMLLSRLNKFALQHICN